MTDGLNEYRTARVAEVLADFRSLQYCIAAAPVHPEHPDDFYTEGWTVLRQCAFNGQYILDVGADVSVPRTSGGPEEQAKAELRQVLLDAYGRRHEAQKIYLRQGAAMRWIEWRDQILMGSRPNLYNCTLLRACDAQLRTEMASITDYGIYVELQVSDIGMARWVAEDPSLRQVQRWVRSRR